MSSPILKVENLHVNTSDDSRTLVNKVSFEIYPGEALGVVGESGSGKTLSALSILGLLPRGVRTTSGTISFNGQDLLALDTEQLRGVRGRQISMIYQDPMTALNPVMRLGKQLEEVFDAHGISNINRTALVSKAFKDVGIADPERAMRSYPHEFSGGMRQRVVIAMALLLSPQIVIADEPTTALDVTIQQQILSLVSEQRMLRNMSMLWITHDLGVVANLVDRVAVMYAGRIVEVGEVSAIFNYPQHPYTQGLLASLPKASDKTRTKLTSISGIPPKPWSVTDECAFAKRCSVAIEKCGKSEPFLKRNSHTTAACFLREGDSL